MAISKISNIAPEAINQVSATATPAVTNTTVNENEEISTSKIKQDEEEDVIAKSEDGDLLTGAPKATYTNEERVSVISESEDGVVSKVEKIPADEELITNLTGYTKTQIEQLYREGKISRYAYDQNVEKREERLEEATKTSADNENEVLEAADDRNTANLRSDALDRAFDNNREDIMIDIFQNNKM